MGFTGYVWGKATVINVLKRVPQTMIAFNETNMLNIRQRVSIFCGGEPEILNELLLKKAAILVSSIENSIFGLSLKYLAVTLNVLQKSTATSLILFPY